MGSKMAVASRVVQTVKPHVSTIRFPDRKNGPKPNVQEVLKSMIFPFTTPPITAHQTASDNPPGNQNILSIRKAQGSSLPQKYRGKSMSNKEMEYIQRGGPE
ncbi:alpha-ketoglutarate dehydrogenase component 4-like [Bombina bombina]|uniref:alpha-ketoglutarate dehydrogenase component 4-like n=1 Tax=Bombina bombina TaxID=8345 RepID=UPI00235A54EE|nr:alpha-ketoglutarate dehydrogenase component 4-like [Bombina bombina]